MNRSLAEIVRRQTPAILPITTSVQNACRMMRDRRVGAILVTDYTGRLVGIFTGRDVVGRVVAEARDPSMTSLGAVMTAQPDTIGPRAHAIDALRLMRDAGYRHLPVLEGDKIIGVLSHGDFSGMEHARLDDDTGFWEIL